MAQNQGELIDNNVKMIILVMAVWPHVKRFIHKDYKNKKNKTKQKTDFPNFFLFLGYVAIAVLV